MNQFYVGACSGGGHMGTFGDWVKLKRKEQGITLKELDALTGVSYGAISDWERGRRTPHRDTAVRVAEALHSDPREALEALMADTPGLEPVVVVERVPTDDTEFWDAYEGAPQEDRELAKLLLQRARERERARTIGGTIAE